VTRDLGEEPGLGDESKDQIRHVAVEYPMPFQEVSTRSGTQEYGSRAQRRTL
jgi:hypothetical protein